MIPTRHACCRSSSLGLGLGATTRVLDLGAGKGAAARHLAATFGCHVTCFNLGKNQNAHNLAEARAAGIEERISVTLGNFNHGLPAEWTASFDLVWSQEALCHANDQRKVLAEITRVLKPGGVAVFTDIMRTVRVPPSPPTVTQPLFLPRSELAPPSHASRARTLQMASTSSANLAALGSDSDDEDDLDAVTPPRQPQSPSTPSTATTAPASRSAPRPIATTPPPGTVTSAASSPARVPSSSAPRSWAGSVSSSLGTSLLATAPPRDFSLNARQGTPCEATSETLHATSPGMYMHNIGAVGLHLVDYRDLTEHLTYFYTGMLDEVRPCFCLLLFAGRCCSLVFADVCSPTLATLCLALSLVPQPPAARIPPLHTSFGLLSVRGRG